MVAMYQLNSICNYKKSLIQNSLAVKVCGPQEGNCGERYETKVAATSDGRLIQWQKFQ